MRFCSRCVIPDTRPHSNFDAAGTCSACRASDLRESIDWSKRKGAFAALAKQLTQRERGYDCVIPVSGGKDSTWQVLKCLEYGLRPLAVTWRTPGRTALGAENLENLIRLGVDHIDYRINPEVERRFMYAALKKFGSTAIPMHLAIFAIPLNIAVRFHIPLVVWGENSALEYGGTDVDQTGFELDRAWVAKYGVTHGTTAQDWVGEDLSARDLEAYFWPREPELRESGTRGIFLGYYFPWDVETSLAAAQRAGFKVRSAGPKTGLYNYADIDDDFISVHHFIKWYKFGFTRLFDNLAVEIRRGRMSREDAVRIIREAGDQTPHEDIRRLCEFLRISSEHFFEILETFRNHQIWVREAGIWRIKDFLIADWNWQ